MADILRKFYMGLKSMFPSQEPGAVLYSTDENGLYIDSKSARNRVNPPSDWEETDENSPSYIANKPEIATQDDLTDLNRVLNDLGNEVSELKGDLNTYQEVEIQYEITEQNRYIKYQNGQTEPSANTFSSTNFIDISDYDSISYKRANIPNPDAYSGMAFYDASNQYISGLQVSTSQSITGYLNDLYVTDVPSNAKYARFSCFSDTNTYGEFAIYGITLINIGDTISSIENDLYNIKELYNVIVDNNSFVKIDGYITGGQDNKIYDNNTTKSLYFKCLSNKTYSIEKVLSTKFRIGYTTEIPVMHVPVLGFIDDNTVTKLNLTTGLDAEYLVMYYYSSETDSLTESEIYNSIKITVVTDNPSEILSETIKFTEQELSEEQMAQARENIGINIDNTLSISGAVADAKSVGDSLSEAEAWKQSGQEGEVLSKDSEGELTWISLDEIRDEIANINKRVNANSVKLYTSDTSMIWLENVGTSIDVISLIAEGDANTNVRITGFDNTVSSAQDIDAFYDSLDTMNGITSQGEIVEGQAQVSGILRVDSISDSDRAELESRYSDIQIIASKTQEELLDDLYTALDDGTYVSKYHVGDIIAIPIDGTYFDTVVMAVDTDVDADGDTIPLTLGTVDCVGEAKMNNTATNSGGWASSAMRSIVSGYESKLPSELQYRLASAKKYSTIYGGSEQVTYDKLWIPNFKELGITSNQEISGPAYSGIYTDNASRIKRLERSNDIVNYYYWTRTANSSYNSDFRSILPSGEFNSGGATYALGIALCFCLDSKQRIEQKQWTKFNIAIQNDTVTTDYTLGQKLQFTTTDGDTYHAQIVGFNKDVDANDQTIPVTMIMEELWKTKYSMNSSDTNSGGWNSSTMRISIMPTLKVKLPEYVTEHIVSVKKYSTIYSGTEQTTIDELWIPNYKELGFTSSQESGGASYSEVFNGNGARIKNFNGEASYYWTRTSDTSNTNFINCVRASGEAHNTYASTELGITLGFCIG